MNPSSSAKNMENRTVEIYDVTLRDGTQGENISFSIHDKIRITEKLDELGVHYIGNLPRTHSPTSFSVGAMLSI